MLRLKSLFLIAMVVALCLVELGHAIPAIRREDDTTGGVKRHENASKLDKRWFFFSGSLGRADESDTVAHVPTTNIWAHMPTNEEQWREYRRELEQRREDLVWAILGRHAPPN